MKTTTISFVSILIIISNLYSQGIPYGQEFQVSTTSQGNRLYPKVAGLADGGFVVCWQRFDSDSNSYNVSGQLYSASGIKIGTQFNINARNGELDWNNPSIAGLADGGFVVCWNNVFGLILGSPNSIFGQIYDAMGAKIGTEFPVGTYIVYLQNYPTVTCLSRNRIFVCYSASGGEQSGSGYGIFGQFFNESGVRQSFEFRINTYTQDNQERQTVSNLSDSGFVVCWQSEKQDGSGYGIFGQLYDDSGYKKGTEFQVNTSTRNNQIYPSVVGLCDDGFVVCWQSEGQEGSGYGIFGQLYDNSGTKKGNEFQVNTDTQNNQMYPSVAGLYNGVFVVCWESEGQDGSGYGIFGQFYNVSGAKLGNEFKLNTYTQGDQRYPTIACLSNGEFIVCWQSKGASSGVFGKRFTKPLMHQLQEYSLLKPLYDATLNTKRPTFIWHQSSKIRENYQWEITFDLYIDTDSNFPHPQIIRNILDTTYTIDSLAAGKTYFWKVLAKNLAGDSLVSTQQDWGFFISPNATSVETAEKNLPTGFELFQNYPNPFNSSTEIKYSLPQNKSSYHVTLKIYDISGRFVNTLVDQNQAAGTYSVSWDGKDINGNDVSSDIYFYVLQADKFKTINKMLLIH